MLTFREWFGSKSSAMIPRSNNFVLTTHNLQLYFIMQVSCTFDVTILIRIHIVRWDDIISNNYLLGLATSRCKDACYVWAFIDGCATVCDGPTAI